MAYPATHLRRTPLRRTLESAGATWRDLSDAAIAADVPTGHKAASGCPGVILVDLTPLPRLGFKGRGTIDAMKKRGVTVEATPNRAFRQTVGGLCLVLAPGEVILLSGLDGDGSRLDEMLASWRLEDEERTYPLLRRDSHAWFAIWGPRIAEFFSKICAIDLRLEKFPDLSIVQTSLAKLSAIITRADEGGRPVFHVLADSASALYLLDALTDAAEELGGRLAGLETLRNP